MYEKRKIKLDDFLKLKPVFCLEEYAEAQGMSSDVDAVRNQLKYHMRLGRVKRVGPSVYAGIPFGQDAQTFNPDRVLVAACVSPDGIFSHHTALELLGVAHSLWQVCTLFGDEPRKSITLGKQRIRFLSHPKRLVKDDKINIGTRKLERQGRQILVTGPERTLIDGFRQFRWVGGAEELVTSASGFASLDLDLLEALLKVYNQRNLWASVGWFLEQFQDLFYVSQDYLNRLASKRTQEPRYLVRSDRGGKLNTRWNLIIPENLSHWEGQHANTQF